MPRKKQQPPPPPRSGPVSSSRALRSKRRKRAGLRLISVILTEDHVDALNQLEWLPRDQRQSKPAITLALEQFLFANLIEKYQHTLWARTARAEREQYLATRKPHPNQYSKQTPKPDPNSQQTTP